MPVGIGATHDSRDGEDRRILVLSRSDLRQLMTFSDYVDVVADAFQLLTQGRCHSPVPTEIREERGTFHIKPGSLPRGAGYVAVKINGNFPSNRASCGLPTIQGAVYLADSARHDGAFLSKGLADGLPIGTRQRLRHLRRRQGSRQGGWSNSASG